MRTRLDKLREGLSSLETTSEKRDAIEAAFRDATIERLEQHRNQDGSVPLADLRGFSSDLSKTFATEAERVGLSSLGYDYFLAFLGKMLSLRVDIVENSVGEARNGAARE